MKWGLILLPALCLGGCLTQEQRIAIDDKQCLSYGVQAGSSAYVDCRTKLDQARSDRLAVSMGANPVIVTGR